MITCALVLLGIIVGAVFGVLELGTRALDIAARPPPRRQRWTELRRTSISKEIDHA